MERRLSLLYFPAFKSAKGYFFFFLSSSPLPPRSVVIAERTAEILLRDAAPEARDATRALAEQVAGPDADFATLAHALLAAGEGPSLLGLLKLAAARTALLEDAT